MQIAEIRIFCNLFYKQIHICKPKINFQWHVLFQHSVSAMILNKHILFPPPEDSYLYIFGMGKELQ